MSGPMVAGRGLLSGSGVPAGWPGPRPGLRVSSPPWWLGRRSPALPRTASRWAPSPRQCARLESWEGTANHSRLFFSLIRGFAPWEALEVAERGGSCLVLRGRGGGVARVLHVRTGWGITCAPSVVVPWGVCTMGPSPCRTPGSCAESPPPSSAQPSVGDGRGAGHGVRGGTCHHQPPVLLVPLPHSACSRGPHTVQSVTVLCPGDQDLDPRPRAFRLPLVSLFGTPYVLILPTPSSARPGPV